jgi:PAS domain S-box-containing protein
VGNDISFFNVNPIRASSVVALALLAAFILLGYFVWSSGVAHVKGEARRVNLAGRQRMLVERIGTISDAIVNTSDPIRVSRLREHLAATLAQIEDSHNQLLSEFGPLSPAVEKLYFQAPAGIDARLREFTGSVRALAKDAGHSLATDNVALRYIQNNLFATVGLLDHAVAQYQLESEQAVEHSIAIDTLLGGATLLALLGTGFFIFRPMERRTLARHASELESANKALAIAQHELQLQYDNAPDLLLSIDLDTQMVVRCNATTATKLGYTKDEMIGMSRINLYAPECRDRAMAAFSEFHANGRVDDVELQALCKDGSIIDVSLSAVHYCDPDGGAGYSDAIWRDISARKRAEREISKRDRKLTTLYLLGEQMLLSKALHPMMHNVAYCLYETLDAKCVVVCSLSRERSHVTVEAGFGMPRRCVGAEPSAIESGSLVDASLRSGGVVSVAPGEVSCRLSGIEYLDAEHVSRGLACAITGSWEARGLIMVFIKRGCAYAEEDMDYLQSLANLLGVAADRIQLEQSGRCDKNSRSRPG